MRNSIEKYIDTCLISEYADKDFKHGYSLEVANLSDHEKSNFLDLLFRNDPVLKEMALDRMQELIEQRLPRIEAQDRYDAGFKPRIDHINGEVIWN